MKLLYRILGRLNVLHVRFGADGGTEITLVTYAIKNGKPLAGEKKPVQTLTAEKEILGKAPLVMAVSGKGVITKDSSAGGIIETVVSDHATFASTAGGDGRVSFVRREQFGGVMSDLESTGVTPVSVECMPDENEDTLAAAAGKFYSQHLKWKKILTPSTEGSLLAAFVAKRTRLPVLGVMLALLVANFIVSPRVREDLQAANIELAALRKSASTATSSNDRRQAAIEQFSNRLPYRFSLLADRIAAAVPEKIVLGEISISPVTKTIEAGKALQLNERSVVIRGETAHSESIASFVEALGGIRSSAVRLSGVEHDNDRSVLTFRIEMEL